MSVVSGKPENVLEFESGQGKWENLGKCEVLWFNIMRNKDVESYFSRDSDSNSVA